MLRPLLEPSEYAKWAEISLSNLRHNLALIRKRISHDTEVMGIVKANAYGHNISLIAPELYHQGITHFGVATLSEAVYLESLLPQVQILILGALLPGQMKTAIQRNYAFMLFDLSDLPLIQAHAQGLDICARIHIKIDSGMGRVGVLPIDFEPQLSKLQAMSHIQIEGLCSHLATSDRTDCPHIQNQLAVFEGLIEKYQAQFKPPLWIHSANSDAILKYPQSHYNLVRPGLALYGYCSFEGVELKPVMSLKARITQIKELPDHHGIGYGRCFITSEPTTRIGIVPMGYADGLNCLLAGSLNVNIAGEMRPLLGRISMDQCVVDLTGMPEAQVGDLVVFLGEDSNSADDWAKYLGTISYEVLTGVTSRVPRFESESFA